MAKEITNGYTLICPGCGAQITSPSKSVVCVKCGNIAVMPPLSDGAFEDVDETTDTEATKPTKKSATDTKNRPADDGGRSF